MRAVVDVVGSVASCWAGSSVGVTSEVVLEAGASAGGAGVSVGAAEVGEPAEESPSPQAVAIITNTKPIAPTLSHEGLLDMALSLRPGGDL